MKTLVVLNEQHKLLLNQKELIEGAIDKEGYSIVNIPSTGLKLSELVKLSNSWHDSRIIFASPIPALIKLVAEDDSLVLLVFHNDKREKKELSDGRIISVTSKTGWELV